MPSGIYIRTEGHKQTIKEGCLKSKKVKRGKDHPNYGKRCANWKGGRTISSQGYVHIFNPKNPRADKKGYVPEQILVMEKKLGRFLTKIEVVHHENEIRNDNRPENLKLYLNENEHHKYHLWTRSMIKEATDSYKYVGREKEYKRDRRRKHNGTNRK